MNIRATCLWWQYSVCQRERCNDPDHTWHDKVEIGPICNILPHHLNFTNFLHSWRYYWVYFHLLSISFLVTASQHDLACAHWRFVAQYFRSPFQKVNGASLRYVATCKIQSSTGSYWLTRGVLKTAPDTFDTWFWTWCCTISPNGPPNTCAIARSHSTHLYTVCILLRSPASHIGYTFGIPVTCRSHGVTWSCLSPSLQTAIYGHLQS
jgi:hypothetical protein